MKEANVWHITSFSCSYVASNNLIDRQNIRKKMQDRFVEFETQLIMVMFVLRFILKHLEINVSEVSSIV